jgi:hypothetical protein
VRKSCKYRIEALGSVLSLTANLFSNHSTKRVWSSPAVKARKNSVCRHAYAAPLQTLLLEVGLKSAHERGVRLQQRDPGPDSSLFRQIGRHEPVEHLRHLVRIYLHMQQHPHNYVCTCKYIQEGRDNGTQGPRSVGQK